jgi:hypothetical protein
MAHLGHGGVERGIVGLQTLQLLLCRRVLCLPRTLRRRHRLGVGVLLSLQLHGGSGGGVGGSGIRTAYFNSRLLKL